MYSFSACELAPTAKDYGLIECCDSSLLFQQVAKFLGVLLFCRPSGMGFRRSAKFGTPARRAARWGRLWGCALLHSDAKPSFAGLGRHRQPSRRAERHGYQSLTARQSRDLLLISGRVDCVNTPSPLASPPEAPRWEKFSIPVE